MKIPLFIPSVRGGRQPVSESAARRKSNLISHINIERKITRILNGGGGKRGRQSEARVSERGSPPGPPGGEINISGVAASPRVRLAWKRRGRKPKCRRRKKKKAEKLPGKCDEPRGRNFSGVAIGRGGNAFFCLRWERESTRRGNAGFRSRRALETRVIYTSNLSKQRLRVEPRARTLCRPGTYIKRRRASAPQLLITAPALIHLSRRQFGRWTLFTTEAVRGGFGRQPSISRLSPKKKAPERISFHQPPRDRWRGSPRAAQ